MAKITSEGHPSRCIGGLSLGAVGDGFGSLRHPAKKPDASLGAPTISFTYHVTGQRATMTDALGTTHYSYNLMRRLTDKNMPVAFPGDFQYKYDAAGNVASINAAGHTQTYTYDALNRLKTASRMVAGVAQTTTYNYDAVGNLADVTAPNGVKHAYSYNTKNQLTNLGVTNSAATTLKNYTYTLAPSGHRLSVAELSGRTATYTYDNIWRLTKEEITGDTSTPAAQNGDIRYTYDKVGNRKSRISAVAAISTIAATQINYDENDRMSTGTEAYDANGSTLTSGEFAYTYDFENRIIKAEKPSVANDDVLITYDGDGHRVRKVVAGVTTTYMVDELNPTGYAQVIKERTSGVDTDYVYGLDLISQRRSSVTHYFGYDGHGSVRFLTDAAGTVTDTIDYDAFGNILSRTTTNTNGQPTPTHYLYAGEQFDSDLGLYYNRARYLDVRSGRFWTVDTFEGTDHDPPSLHKYLYAAADPANNFDPSGRFTLPETNQVLGNIASLTNISLRVLRAVDFATSAADAIRSVTDILQVVSSGQVAQYLDDAVLTTQQNSRFSAREAVRSLERNFKTILSRAIGPWSAWIIQNGANITGFRIYLPNPIPALLPQIQIKTGLKIGRKPVTLIAGGTNHPGRVIGVGLQTKGLNNPGFTDIWRMDFQPFHFGRGVGGGYAKADEISVWVDNPFHYHVLRPKP